MKFTEPLRNISLRFKLLGMYLVGLALIGVLGYGFFIFMQVESYRADKQLLRDQARFFGEKASEQVKYTIDLRNVISNLYKKSLDHALERGDLINDFISDVALINDDNYTFALFSHKGELVSSNDQLFSDIIAANDDNRKKIYALIKETFEDGIHTAQVDFRLASKVQEFFVNSIYFAPLGYYILSVEKTNLVRQNIDRVLETKRAQAFKLVLLSLLIGVLGSSLVLIFLTFYLRSMTRHINSITTSIDSLAASGKTESMIEASNQDEIGRMITSFNRYLQKRVSLEQFKQLIEEDENIEDVYNRIFTLIHDLGIEDFALYDIDETKNKIHFVNDDIGSVHPGLAQMPCSQDILVHADGCRARRLAQVVTGTSRYRECPKFLGYERGQRHMCIPMIIGGVAGEIVHVTMDEDNSAKVEKSLPLLTEYLRNAAPVIESKKLLNNLRETTLTDPMTGLNNRRFFEEYIEVLIAEAQRAGKNLGILMCDLDWFKKVNDDHGHEAGDQVLKTLANIIRDSVRGSDIVIRYGGEEFLIIIRNAEDAETVVSVAEKIRTLVEETEMRVSPSVVLTKTLSIGVSLYPQDTENFWQAIKFADISLYSAKEEGRNQVVRFVPELWTDFGGEY
jgi:diguanylate cyclase (GGDEF)-like protein